VTILLVIRIVQQRMVHMLMKQMLKIENVLNAQILCKIVYNVLIIQFASVVIIINF